MNEQFFSNLMENVNDLIIVIGLEGDIVYINGRITEWGYEKNELIGKPVMDFLKIRQMGNKQSVALQFGVKRIFDMEVNDNLGNTHRVIINSSPMTDENGNITGMIVIIRDISELKKLEETLFLDARLASLGRLATGIAHEIRNPLSSVKMNLMILRQRMKPAGVELEHFQIAADAVSNMETIVNELLDYAKPSPLQKNRHNIQKTIENVVKQVKIQASERRIAINVDCAIDIPPVRFDKGKISQAILNVLVNAIQASENGSAIEVDALMVREERDWARISITDSGAGIDVKDILAVFDPFYTTKPSGTGLGLPIVRNIMRNHGGEITIQSEKGKGTKVNLDLPVS